jgi:hypothetical protein
MYEISTLCLGKTADTSYDIFMLVKSIFCTYFENGIH